MNDKAIEALLLAAGEQEQGADALLTASRRLEQEARKLLDAVKVCFPQPPAEPLKKLPALYFQPPSNDWLH